MNKNKMNKNSLPAEENSPDPSLPLCSPPSNGIALFHPKPPSPSPKPSSFFIFKREGRRVSRCQGLQEDSAGEEGKLRFSSSPYPPPARGQSRALPLAG